MSQGLFPKERFRYDGGEDIYICPNGQRLAPYGKRKRRDIFFVSYANRAACKECQLKSKCTKRVFCRVLRYVGFVKFVIQRANLIRQYQEVSTG